MHTWAHKPQHPYPPPPPKENFTSKQVSAAHAHTVSPVVRWGGAGKSPGKPALSLHGEKWCGHLSTVPTTLQGGTMINCLGKGKTKFGDVSWGHLTNNRAGCKCQAWLWGTVLSASCFLVNFNKWNFFLKETVYLSVHNDINPLLPSDLAEYDWVRRENGQMTGLSKVTPCNNSIGVLGFASQFSWENIHMHGKKRVILPENF